MRAFDPAERHIETTSRGFERSYMEKFHRLATLMEVCVGLLNLIFHRRDDGSDHIVGLDLIACGRLVDSVLKKNQNNAEQRNYQGKKTNGSKGT